MRRVVFVVLAAMLVPALVSAQSHRRSDVDQLVNSHLRMVRQYADPWNSGPRFHPGFGWDDQYSSGYRGYDSYRPQWGRSRRSELGRSLGTALVAAGAYTLGRAHGRNDQRREVPPEPEYYPERREAYEPEVQQGGTPFVRNSSGAQVQLSCGSEVVDLPGLPEGVLRAGGKIEHLPCSVDQIQAFGWFPDADDQRTVQEVRYTRTFSGGLLLYPPQRER